MTEIGFIDLFAGTGGFSVALERASPRFRCLFANDMSKASEAIYRENHPAVPFVLGSLLDIAPEDIPAHQLLCGGFPCQPFSVAGARKGFGDPRANVFWKIVEILDYHRPRMLLLENVKNLKSHDSGRTFDTIKGALEGIGYDIYHAVLDSAKISGIPHHRERIYIVGFLRDLGGIPPGFSLAFPEIPPAPMISFLEGAQGGPGGLLEGAQGGPGEVAEKYYYTDRFAVYDRIRPALTERLRDGTIYQFRRHYVRKNRSGVCPTLTANIGSGGHNCPIFLDDIGRIRKLTPRECFNFQGFPADYRLPEIADSHLYKLAGNAITVGVVELIGARLVEYV